MAHLETSITINRPSEEVFAFVVDPQNAVKWEGSVVDAANTSSGPIGVGTTQRYSFKFVGQKIESTSKITVYDAPRQFAWKSTAGPFPVSGGYTFESVPGGTRMIYRTDVEPGGFFKLAGPLLTRQMQSQLENDLKKLKQVLEAQA